MPVDGNGHGNGKGHRSPGANGAHAEDASAARTGQGRPRNIDPGGDGLLKDILVPGQHLTPGGRVETSENDFAEDALSALPHDLLYVSSATLGVLAGTRGCREFQPVGTTEIRWAISPFVRPVEWRRSDKGNIYQHPVRRSDDLAKLIHSRARFSEKTRRIVRVVQYPVYRDDLSLSPPGWSPDGTYFDAPPSICAIEPETQQSTIQEILEDLVVDFPFKEIASRENFYGLLLTPILRPAIDGNVPLHLVIASLERTGKSKLLEEVLGGVILGRPMAAQHLPEDSAELKKEIISLLIEGNTVIHLDNLGEFLDSPLLASLLTACYIKGRLLGLNKTATLLNTLIVTASGNNVRATGEVVKRTVPIRLQPKDDHPEYRIDFIHPELRAYVAAIRPAVLAALLGMVERWKSAGRPPGTKAMGGFEAWARVIGGILQVNGFDQWMTNADEWRKASDPDGEDIRSFVTEWARCAWDHKSETTLPRSSTELMALAQRFNLFQRILCRPTLSAVLSAFSKTVLSRNLDRPVLGLVIERKSSGNNSSYHLTGDKETFANVLKQEALPSRQEAEMALY